MKSDKVDPAALLIAIVAVVGAPLLDSGPWLFLNSVIAAVVLVVVYAYAVAGVRRTYHHMFIDRLAISVIIGLITAIMLAFPLQALAAGTMSEEWCDNSKPLLTPPSCLPPSCTTEATWLALTLGLAAAVALTSWLHLTKREPPEDPMATLTRELVLLRQALADRSTPDVIETTPNVIETTPTNLPPETEPDPQSEPTPAEPQQHDNAGDSPP